MVTREQWDSYSAGGGVPELSSLARWIDDRDSPAAIAAAEGRAGADVMAAYGRAKDDFRRTLGRYGMRPGSGKFVSGLRALALGEAADRAGARTNARVGVLDRAIRNRTGLASLGLQKYGTDLGAATQRYGIDKSAETSRYGIDIGSATQRYGVDVNAKTAADRLALDRYRADLTDATQRYGIDTGFESTKYAADQGLRGTQYGAASRRSGSGSGWLSGVGSVIGGIAGIFSDRRFKTDIAPIGTLPNELSVYEFSYIDDEETVYTGVMADEVFDVLPEAVGEKDGYLYVDYGAVIADSMNRLD